MTPYHLAKLVEWAGEKLNSRKRLQKVIYLLQEAGCTELDVDFILHRYGPYSTEVAALTNQMVNVGLLEEDTSVNRGGTQFSYHLSDRAKQAITALHQRPHIRSPAKSFDTFETSARRLLGTELSELEYGATIVFFHRQHNNWDQALEKACKFKRLDRNSDAVHKALELAKSVTD